MARFRFPLAALLAARERDKEAAVAAFARADADRRRLEHAAASLRERQARLRGSIGQFARTAPPETLRRAYLLMESFDGSIADADRQHAASAERAAAALATAKAATRAWKQVELLETKARAEHVARVAMDEERELDDANGIAAARAAADPLPA